MFTKKHLSKKEQDELKKKQEDQAAADVLQDFVASFDSSGKAMPKMFVKGSIINPLSKDETPAQDRGALYKPALKLIGKTFGSSSSSSTPPATPTTPLSGSSSSSLSQNRQLNSSATTPLGAHKKEQQASADEAAAFAALAEQDRQNKKKAEEKKSKSNLEMFKEELKKLQLEREERHRKKQQGIKTPEDEPPAARQANKSEFESNLKSDLDLSQEVTPSSANSAHQQQQHHHHHHTATSSFNRPHSVDDPNTTNIFISNLNPKTNEQDIIQRFGKYGLLASVKIMWPRSDEEKLRNANCGFVAFMKRRDADIALKELDGCPENGQPMRLSWSKSIALPSQPIYVPPELLDATLPPPPSGLPFNAQPKEARRAKRVLKKLKRERAKRKQRQRKRSTSGSGRSRSSSRSSQRSLSASSSDSSISSVSSSSSSSSSSSASSSADSSRSPSSPSHQSRKRQHGSGFNLKKILKNALVKVVIPTDRILLALIHRVIEFVVTEGPGFEAMLMTKEHNNPQFRFLFDNQSVAHIYYRWKLFSILQGNSVAKWNTKPFRMFVNGSYWMPPPLNRYTEGLPDEAYEKAVRDQETQKNTLNKHKKKKLDKTLKNLTLDRRSISEAMVFCIENAERADEIVSSIFKSLTDLDMQLNKKVAHMYLLSDVLHNCCAKVPNAHYYRKGFEQHLPRMFQHLGQVYMSIDGKMKSESFKQKILSCIRAWEDWTMYPNDYLVNLQNTFLGLAKQESTSSDNDDDDDLDGKPLDEESSMNETVTNKKSKSKGNDNSDGDPDADDTDENIDGKPLDDNDASAASKMFMSSKWEAVDPDKLEKQAITTSKWDFYDENEKNGTRGRDDERISDANQNNDDDDSGDEDIDGKPMDDEDDSDLMARASQVEAQSSPLKLLKESTTEEGKRKMLREIEVKVMKYIDDLENGLIKKDPNANIQDLAESYRRSLIKEYAENGSHSFAQVKVTRSRSSSTSSSNSSNKSNERKKKRHNSNSPKSKSRSNIGHSSSRKSYR